MISVVLYALLNTCLADVRLAPEQQGTAPGLVYREPSTFGYKALEQQRKNDRDQFLRSNVDNEANKRNAATEAPQDMLPCRQDEKRETMTLTRGVAVELPLRWNNPHDSDCEVNVWVKGMSQVAPIKRPFRCGGGYQDQRTSFTIPTDFPGCETADEKCVVQIYGHSVETRTYAMCIDFVLKPGAGLTRRRLFSRAAADSKDLTTTKFQAAVHYWDSFDTSHVDSQFSGYRGQQEPFIRDELKAIIKVRSYLGNGGLVPLGNVNQVARAQLEAKVKVAIAKAEAAAIKSNKAAQAALDAGRAPGSPKVCFEGDLYNVVNNGNCNRQYTNTYVTNVGYRQILAQFEPQFLAAGLVSYTPKIKNIVGCTPDDSLGAYKGKNGKPEYRTPPACTPIQPPVIVTPPTPVQPPVYSMQPPVVTVQPVTPPVVIVQPQPVTPPVYQERPPVVIVQPQPVTPPVYQERPPVTTALPQPAAPSPAPVSTVAPVAPVAPKPAYGQPAPVAPVAPVTDSKPVVEQPVAPTPTGYSESSLEPTAAAPQETAKPEFNIISSASGMSYSFLLLGSIVLMM